ncbi:ankyrin repeat and zinc finger domain-containing protein 1-like [Mercenaria mercenaria]|uniref:ankyrin repeat and zinc finger domain-containing protein 1-like n=1 Tax=Mercenaria mercenaria TaxID=6596 RepID=UPI00234F7EB8|nr:ankyrin repeat and zinc finger domain-containing protein 1-like [Mercenaria mercenaria]
MATNSPKKTQRVKPKSYSTCLLYNTTEAQSKLSGITLASCNPSLKSRVQNVVNTVSEVEEVAAPAPELLQLTVSDKMSCNYCDAVFAHRVEQKRHYRSDWHRYNLKLRLKGKDRVSEEQFEDISGNISSLSGSDSDSEADTDTDKESKTGSGKKLPGSPHRRIHSGNTSTDSESESGNQTEDVARRLPKVYFRNKNGDLLSIYRCVLCHKKSHPSQQEDLVTLATSVPDQMNWAVFMAAGGHFAGAVFNKNQMVAHKTFHRYVVRAKRGTAQGSRDSQGNAPKSAGATLRRYNEAALTQEIQELIASWSEHIQSCDRIFLRAPSFNRKIFFSGKSPPLNKDDERIRLIPFQTRRPTFNEVRRVYEMLASIECYGDETDMQDLVPISPPQVFNPETGQLTPRDETQLTPRQRKLLNRRLGTSPLAMEENKASSDADEKSSLDKDTEKTADGDDRKELKSFLPGHVLEDEHMSSGTSTASDTELVETMTTINFMELKEFAYTKKPKKKKKSAKKRTNSLKCQTEPETNVMEEEKYHLKNSLYTACKVGDKEALKSLLAILYAPQVTVEGQTKEGQGQESEEKDGDVTNDSEPQQLRKDNNCDKPFNENSDKEIEKTACSLSQEENIKQTIDSDIIVNQQSKSCSASDLFKNEIEQTNTIPRSTSTDINSGINLAEEAGYQKDNSGNSDFQANVDDSTNVKVTGDQPDNMSEEIVGINKTDSTFQHENSSENSNISNVETGINVAVYSKSQTDIHTEKASLHLVTTSCISSVTGTWPDFSPVVTPGLLTEPFGDNNTTLLHVAAKEGQGAIIRILMESGANPAVRDKGGLTPYMVAKDKATRNEFRRFMGKWPDKYDYEKAQIPGPLTEEMENERKRKDAERKKAQKKVKQEQQKEKRKEEEKQKAEEREKQRFLNLSDREKRALAAEKRLVSQVTSQGAAKPVLSRCFQCASDMTGKVPFEYCDNKFCSSKCLQQHRKSQKKS